MNTNKGLYIAAACNRQTTKALSDFCAENNIENVSRKFHSTICYSTQPASIGTDIAVSDINAIGYTFNDVLALPAGFEVWKTQSGDFALVLKLASRRLEYLHSQYMELYALSYDYPVYKPHITLSYNVGEDFDLTKIPFPDFAVAFSHIYAEELILDWQNKGE